MTPSESVHRMIDDLPADLRQEAIHYIEELARRKKNLWQEVQPDMCRGAFQPQKTAQNQLSSSIRLVSGGTYVYLLDTNILIQLVSQFRNGLEMNKFTCF